MAISKGIIDELGGTIFVNSEVGNGTTVTVDLALLLTNNENAGAEALEESCKSIVDMKILIVEKNPLAILVARRLLEKKGAQVYLAENGLKALELFENSGAEGFDCILINLCSAEIDGAATAKKLRQSNHPLSGSIPMIGLGEKLTQEEKHLYVEAGINDFLETPLKFTQLLEIILNLCKNG